MKASALFLKFSISRIARKKPYYSNCYRPNSSRLAKILFGGGGSLIRACNKSLPTKHTKKHESLRGRFCFIGVLRVFRGQHLFKNHPCYPRHPWLILFCDKHSHFRCRDRSLQNWSQHRNRVIPKPACHRPVGYHVGGDRMGAGKISVLTPTHFAS